jgi:UDP-N-acetylmuramoylalanine--D-glutamate ligase
LTGAVSKKLGIRKVIIRKIIKKFHGTEHRLERVKRKDTILFYNDSAATNPISTEAAIQALPGPITLIAGGQNKGFNYKTMGQAIDSSRVTKVFLIGRNKKEIASAIHRPPVYFAKTLEESIHRAYEQAEPQSTILFSPASASFDMFKNYDQRGKLFKSIVHQLKNRKYP